MTLMLPSPCIGVCRLADDTNLCAGCHRTLSEIAAWHRLTETEKLHILERIQERKVVEEAKNTIRPMFFAASE